MACAFPVAVRLLLLTACAYPRFKKWGTNHGEREERGAECADGVGCEEVVPLPTGERSGEVAMPPPQNFVFDYELKIARFGAF